MSNTSTYEIWKTYPTGKIPGGTFCDCCARYNVRNSTTEALIVNEHGEVLLIKRGQEPQKGWWGLPGGYVGWNETVEQAAKREAEEETGLVVKSVEFFGLYDDPKRDLDGRQNIGHCFIAQVEGSLKKQDEEVEDIQWFSLDTLPEHIAFDHRTMIEDYKILSAQSHSGSKKRGTHE